MNRTLDESLRREDFLYFQQAKIRWGDNDQYGHLNNACYYTLFENTIMYYLEHEAGLSVSADTTQCFTVENGCRFLAPLSYPQITETGLRVAHLGNSSVRYELGIFVEGELPVCAVGFGVDVFVDPATGKPTRIPDAHRRALSTLQLPDATAGR